VHESIKEWTLLQPFALLLLPLPMEIISRVNENNPGGKVVFLRDANTGNNLYYAHLDSQIAVEGQKVKTGDTVGLVGKTGNARNTVPHLHFGIYTIGGAINPLPFINPDVKEPKKIAASLASEKVNVLGVYGGFYLVNYKGVEGWITKPV
jgi:hypothetical protein